MHKELAKREIEPPQHPSFMMVLISNMQMDSMVCQSETFS